MKLQHMMLSNLKQIPTVLICRKRTFSSSDHTSFTRLLLHKPLTKKKQTPKYDSNSQHKASQHQHKSPSLKDVNSVGKIIDDFDSSDEAQLYHHHNHNIEEEEELDTGDADPRHLLGKQLLAMGRVRYRHVERLPDWFLERQEEICNYRTRPQIRRCLRDWMIHTDRSLQLKFRTKALQWGHQLPNDSQRSTTSKQRLYGPDETVAYSFYHMPSKFTIVKRVLQEISLLNPIVTATPRRVLDFGCGPGTVAAALEELWGSKGLMNGHKPIAKYVGVDISQSMIDAAKLMTQPSAVIDKAYFYNNTTAVVKRYLETRAQRQRTGGQRDEERFDLAVASYTLSELNSDPARRIATQMLFEMLDVGGYLVIVEPGNPQGSHTVRTARQFVLDTFNHVDDDGIAVSSEAQTYFDSASANSSEIQMMLPPPSGYNHDQLGAYVIAPCTHDGRCPLPQGQWCSFSQKVRGGVIRKDSEEKFSYVIIQKRGRLPKQQPSHGKVRFQKSASAVGAVGETAESLVSDLLEGIPAPRKRLSNSSMINGADRQTIPPPPEQQRLWGRWVDSNATTRSNSDGNPDMEQNDLDPTPLQVLDRFVGVRKNDVHSVVNELVDEIDWEEYSPPLWRSEWGRIVRSPIKNKGHVIMDLCHPNGTLQRSTLSRSNLLNVPSLYIALRKTSWGGLFPVLPGLAISADEVEAAAKMTGFDDSSNRELQRLPVSVSAKGINKVIIDGKELQNHAHEVDERTEEGNTVIPVTVNEIETDVPLKAATARHRRRSMRLEQLKRLKKSKYTE